MTDQSATIRTKTDERQLRDYVQALYQVDGFESAFSVLENATDKLGFGGVLYTYIPKVLIDSNFTTNPVYKVSSEYSPAYLEHYTAARFDRHDPLIKAVNKGVTAPISWWGDICTSFTSNDKASKEVIATSKDYGISNGVTLPLMCGQRGISGASFITDENQKFEQLLEDKIDSLTLYTKLFHSMVTSNAVFMGQFIKPLLASLSDTEKKYLVGLASGKSPTQIAAELNRTEKYLEQVMLRIRRKLSGVGSEDTPVINRNQLLYYAGLLNILEFPCDAN